MKIEIDVGEDGPGGGITFVDIFARLICYVVGIEPVDSTDGSPNWWMFRKDAEAIIGELRSKYKNPKE